MQKYSLEEIEEALKLYEDFKTDKKWRNAYKHQLSRNLRRYYNSMFSTDTISGEERFAKRIRVFDHLADNLIDKLFDAGFKVAVVSSCVGMYNDYKNSKHAYVACTKYAITEQTDLFEMLASQVKDKENQVIALYLPIVGYKTNLECFYQIATLEENK